MKPITEPMEVFRHQRQVRAFDPRPVPDDAILEVIRAATHGPSGSNTQPWQFIVVRDPEVKSALSEHYEAAFKQAYGDRPPPRGQDRQPFTEVPVLIVCCVRKPNNGRAGFQTGASIYPSIQNLMLAARILGLGTGITTLHRLRLAEVNAILGIPDEWENAAIVLLGYPDRHYGPNRRNPVEEFVRYDHWTPD